MAADSPQHNPQHPEASTADRALGLAVAAGGHVLGTLVVFSVFVLLYFNGVARHVAIDALAQPRFLADHWGDLALQLGLSACLWALVVIGVKVVAHARRDRKEVTRLSANRGAVLTETLIVFPVLLLLTCGLIQLALNSTAGLLTTLASYHAGRTAAIWAPEAAAGRNDVDMAIVEDKVRIAAASLIAPVVPSAYVSRCNDRSEALDDKIDLMQTAMSGNWSTQANAVRASGERPNLSVAAAFDTQAFGARGIPKLRFAYCATEIEVRPVNDEKVVTDLLYHHQQAIPLTEFVFGERRTVGGRLGWFMTLDRSYETTMQIAPNPVSPL